MKKIRLALLRGVSSGSYLACFSLVDKLRARQAKGKGSQKVGCEPIVRGFRNVVALALALLACPVIAEDTESVRVLPKETDEILANPGMGWETFHTTANDDKNRPSWIPSTVHYARWGWNVLEPERGKIDYNS